MSAADDETTFYYTRSGFRMNHRSLISLLLLLSTALALLNYYTSFGLTNVNVGDAEAHSFSPPQTEFRVKAPTRRNNSTSNTSLFNFTLKTINPQISGRLAPQRRTGIAFSSPTKHKNNGDHWWSYTDSCFAVDDICRIPDNRWFYFQHNPTTTNQSNDIAALKWQPSFELKYMPHTYQRGVYADTRVQMNVHASHRIAWDELEQTNQCRVSTDPYHVILQSLFNDMVGEFYSRTLMYMYRLLSVAPSLKVVFESMNMTLLNYNHQPIEESQYYIHITIANKGLLDAHKLLLSGMHRFNNTQSKWAKSAVDLLWPENSSECQCYQKLVFCGYNTYLQQNYSSEMYTLWPSKYIDETGDEIEGPSACNPVSPLFTSMSNECQEFAKLKSYVLSNIEANYPGIEKTVIQHRRSILMKLHRIDESYSGDTKDWSIVGLAQRYSRRVWLNLQNVTEACNAKFYDEKVVCIEVNVEGTHSPHEQFLLHRSLDVLIGVHGAQLTQAVFLKPHGHVLELLPWIPVYIQGGWTARTSRPTPLGIIFHNTDLNHYGYSLNRSSVPLCEKVSPEREKDCFTSDKYKRRFAWSNRDFLVDDFVVTNFVEKFVLPNQLKRNCYDFQSEEEFVLYNVWCNNGGKTTGSKETNSIHLQVKHFYRKKARLLT